MASARRRWSRDRTAPRQAAPISTRTSRSGRTPSFIRASSSRGTPVPGAAPTDEELLKLLQRKALLEGELEELKIRKAFLAAGEYAKEFERIITEYARIASEVRKRTKS